MPERPSARERLAKDREEPQLGSLFKPTKEPSHQKMMVYIRPTQFRGLEALRYARLQEIGKAPDKSSLVREAIDLLFEKHGILERP